MDKQLRKFEINLEILGTGIIMCCIWMVAKCALLSSLYNMYLSAYFSKNELVIVNIIIWVVVAVEVLVRGFIGVSAKASGMGQSRSNVYLVLTVIVFVSDVIFVILEIISFFSYDYSLSEAIVTVIIDVTSLALILEVLVYECKLRKLRKNITEEDCLHES